MNQKPIFYATRSSGCLHRFHYWHFMAGYFLPVILRPDAGRVVFVQDCGEMDRHWTAVKDRRIQVGGVPSSAGAEILQNYDFPHCEDFTPGLLADFRAKVWAATKLQPPESPPDRFLLIDRGAAPAFYQEHQRQSAAARRRFVNPGEILAALQTVAPFELHTLENKTLPEQMELFSSARAIVMQHGAACFNLAFCQKGAVVVESGFAGCKPYYQRWAEACGVRRVYHENPATNPANPKELGQCLQSILKN